MPCGADVTKMMNEVAAGVSTCYIVCRLIKTLKKNSNILIEGGKNVVFLLVVKLHYVTAA